MQRSVKYLTWNEIYIFFKKLLKIMISSLNIEIDNNSLVLTTSC